MRDFNNNGQINIQQGSVSISDNYTENYKLLIHCSNEELISERPYRIGNIELEQKRKIKKLIPMYFICACMLIATIYYIYFTQDKEIPSLIFGAGSFIVGYRALIETTAMNEFQREEQEAINEIDKLLKQRRVNLN